MALNGWWVIFIFLILVVVISLLLISNRQVSDIPPAAAHESHGSEQHSQTASEQVKVAEIPLLDDLTKIEGIGPKIASLLSEHGINTFRELANAEVETLDRLLNDARLTFADPTTWPEQAGLADLQKWDDLDELQSQSKGGRKGA